MKNHRQYLGYRRGSWTVDGPGISFILGSWAIKWAYDKGCRRAELLAVRDSDLMNLVLVRLYERSIRTVPPYYLYEYMKDC